MTRMRDDSPVIVVEKSSGALGGFLLGLLVGGAVALLVAPQSGAETRAALKARGRKLREDAKARVDELQDRIEEGYAVAKERLEEGFESARQSLREKRAGAEDALDAGRAAVHSARDELERRLAESRAARGKPAPPSPDEAI